MAKTKIKVKQTKVHITQQIKQKTGQHEPHKELRVISDAPE